MFNEGPRILVLQNSHVEHLGILQESLRHGRIMFDPVQVFCGEVPPDSLDIYAGLIVLGGPQSVYEEEKYPYLRLEKQVVRVALEREMPILGICLGSQILAEALGATVRPGKSFELGWREVTLSSQARLDRIFQAMPPAFVPLHWHGDIYDVPLGAVLLGTSQQTPVQGFAWKGRCYGILFHLEMMEEQIAEMIGEFPSDLMRASVTSTELLSNISDQVRGLKSIANEFFDKWCSLL